MAKKYCGFAIRTEEKEIGVFFKHKETKEIFCRIQVGGVDNFAEAQDILCDKMTKLKMPVAILLPYSIKED